RPDGLRVARDRGQAERREQLAEAEIDDQQSSGGRPANARDQRARPLLQAVALEQADDWQHDPGDRDVAIFVEAMPERREHLQDVHPAQQAGGDRRGRHDQQRIEPEREAEDDQEDAEQRPVVDHSGLPKPPPPGVSITKRSPACTSADSVALSISTEPSVRSTQFRPGWASAPPMIPRGGTRRRLARMFARIGSRKVTSRITPSPPLCAPGPPDPRRIANWSSRTGSRVSRISGSVSRLLVMCVCTALVPSKSGPAPEPPAMVS